MSAVSKDLPLAEITLRRYPKPYKLSKRELCKKLCLSIGLLQPGDSRDVVVDVLHSFLVNKELTPTTILEHVTKERKANDLTNAGSSLVNLRRQLRRLKKLNIVERKGKSYSLAESALWHDVFEQKLLQLHVNPILDRVRDYFKALDSKE